MQNSNPITRHSPLRKPSRQDRDIKGRFTSSKSKVYNLSPFKRTNRPGEERKNTHSPEGLRKNARTQYSKESYNGGSTYGEHL